MDNGWTVNGGSPQLDLYLQSHHLISGISFRPCTGKQCPLPLVFRVVMWNNSNSWIYLKHKSKYGTRTVCCYILLNFCSKYKNALTINLDCHLSGTVQNIIILSKKYFIRLKVIFANNCDLQISLWLFEMLKYQILIQDLFVCPCSNFN